MLFFGLLDGVFVIEFWFQNDKRKEEMAV